MHDISIQIVCLGNICRSPQAEGIFRHLTKTNSARRSYAVSSAGIGGWHVGNPPDRRAIEVARRHGIDIGSQKARQFTQADLARHDLVIAMDNANFKRLSALATPEEKQRLHLFSMLACGDTCDVPDPYYGDAADFETVYSMIFSGCEALFAKLEFERASWSGNTSSVR